MSKAEKLVRSILTTVRAVDEKVLHKEDTGDEGFYIFVAHGKPGKKNGKPGIVEAALFMKGDDKFVQQMIIQQVEKFTLDKIKQIGEKYDR